MIKAENVTFEYDRLDEEGNIESKLTVLLRFWDITVLENPRLQSISTHF